MATASIDVSLESGTDEDQHWRRKDRRRDDESTIPQGINRVSRPAMSSEVPLRSLLLDPAAFGTHVSSPSIWLGVCARATLDLAFNGFIAWGISLIHPLFISVGTLLATPLLSASPAR